MKIIMKHPSGVRKKVKVGFSWTTFFFFWIPSVIRGEYGSALKLLLFGTITFGIYSLVKCFTINRDYKESLLLKGFK